MKLAPAHPCTTTRIRAVVSRPKFSPTARTVPRSPSGQSFECRRRSSRVCQGAHSRRPPSRVDPGHAFRGGRTGASTPPSPRAGMERGEAGGGRCNDLAPEPSLSTIKLDKGPHILRRTCGFRGAQCTQPRKLGRWACFARSFFTEPLRARPVISPALAAPGTRIPPEALLATHQGLATTVLKVRSTHVS